MISSRWIRLAPLGAVLVFTLLMAMGLFTPKEKRQLPPPLVGSSVPAFSLEWLGEDKRYFTPSAWLGRPALISIFASWCEPCRVEHPLLMNLAKQRVIAVYGIAWRDTPENAARYLNGLGNPYQAVGVDPQGFSTLPLALTGVPETLLVDAEGVVRWRYAGPLDEARIREELLPAIAKYAGERANAP